MLQGGIKVTPEEKKRWAENCLREKFHELGRLPRKGDFDNATRSRIKAFLGPWPRALESAGLKDPAPGNEDAVKESDPNGGAHGT